jgi:predicted alpha/beta-hydrolase family hydrolase
MLSSPRIRRHLNVSAEESFPLRFELPDGSVCEARWMPNESPRPIPVLLAHGAGAGHTHPLLAALAQELARERFEVLAFHYPYMTRMRAQGRRQPPDPAARLELAHEHALEQLALLRPGRALLVGKSMGGRIGSVVAAKGASAAGLVLLGYPLHPRAQPERERSEHFRALVQPALFVSGTRDPLCELARLERALLHYGGRATLERIEGADHDFKRRGADGADPVRIALDLVRRVSAWVETTWND